jgi:hypothetical protein
MLMVSLLEWDITAMQDQNRMRRLQYPPTPEELITRVVEECQTAARDGHATCIWEPAAEKAGFFRMHTEFPLQHSTFDCLFNSRAGYRAQYYLGPYEGEVFNRALVEVLAPLVHAVCVTSSCTVPWAEVHASVLGPWSRVWAGGRNTFPDAPERELRPARWVAANAPDGMALRLPLPAQPALEIKGTFVQGGRSWLSPDKMDRVQQLHDRGFA